MFAAMFKKPVPDCPIRAWSVESDNGLVALTGVVYRPGYVEAFADMRHDLGIPKITVWRYTLMLIGRFTKLGIPILALVDPQYDSSKYLEKLGFVYQGVVDENKVYKLCLKQG